ncbi:ABC transporter B family member 15-like [Abrus precatorius]|uniref:ABC transporter B family member 15-like n=1 Tax=Abrus precatorius TaxID=3816 RepID=A0A8B8LTK9_ABRPR|nr:ABC transporter B family member 15-like [Abrus precatorius]
MGHRAKICWWVPKKPAQSDDIPQALAALTLDNTIAETEWTSDTGASNHMTGKPSMLNNIKKYSGTDSVLIGDGSSLSILGIGDSFIKQRNVTQPLHDVLLVPSLTKNLLSISQLTTQFSVNCEFSNVDFCVKKRETGKPMITGRCKGDLYVLSPSPELHYSHRFKSGSANTWHQCLGHPQTIALQLLKNKGCGVECVWKHNCVSVEMVPKAKNGSIQSIFMHADSLDWVFMVFGFLGAIGDGFTTPFCLYITSRIMNNIGSVLTMAPSTFIQNVNKYSLTLSYLATVSFFASFLEGYCWTRTGERQAARMRVRYLKAVLRQDVAYFDLHVSSTSEVITCISNDSLIIQDVLSEKVPNLLMNFFRFLGSYIVAFALLWRLAIVGLPFVILLVIPGLIYGKILMRLARKIRKEYSKAGTIAEQAISSIRTVYSFVGEGKTMDAFSNALQGSVKLGLKQGLARGMAIGSKGVVFAIWSFMAYYGSRLVMYHGAKGGTVFAVGAVMCVGGTALGSCLSDLKYFSEACAAGERIMEMIRRVPKIDSENMVGEILEKVLGEVEFHHVKFVYPSRPNSVILNDFCLKIPVGKKMALVGESGSGKSTVIALLQRFYDPIEGEIRLDGVAIHRLQLKWLRSQMGLVSQEPALFATSIKENILFGREDATHEEIVEAAKAANAHDFISQLPQGYDTQVGEKGVQMSGGQKQRIAIARAIIKNPQILLLDEATSALDSESERKVQEAIDKVAIGRTTIIIAHRLSTIRDACVITVMLNGKIMEMGSHDELMQKNNGFYTSLVHFQQIEKSKCDLDDTHSLTSTSSTSNEDNLDGQLLSFVSHSIPTNLASQSSLANEENAEKDRDDQKFPSPSFWRLFALNLPEWKQAFLGSLSAMLYGAIEPLYAFALGSMISIYFLTNHDEMKRKVAIYSLFFVGLAMFSLVVNIIEHYSFAYMGEYLTKRVKERMLSKILTFEVGWFDREENSTGVVCSRLATEPNTIRSLVGDRMGLLVQTISAVIIACTMGLIIAWRLAIILITVQPIAIGCFYTRLVLLKGMSNKAIKAQDESSKLAVEAVSNLRTITAFSSQDRFIKMLKNAQEGPSRESIRQSWFAGIVLGLARSLTTFTRAIEYWYGGKLVSHGYITSKAMFQTVLILANTGRVIADASSMTSDLAKGTDAVDLVFSILYRNAKIEPDERNAYKPKNLTGQIELHDVCFAYPSRPSVMIFQDFSIKFDAGKSTALVGQSGSGKSTIIGLIERFYDPLKGIVTMDGKDIKLYHLRSLRNYVALVSQEPTLFNGTIRENIAYGSFNKTNEVEIIEAAKAANAHDFISSMKDGYDTWCGDRGVQLSGGQKQRIAIARAILKNPKVLLLDEATSALDSQSEKVVQNALEGVMVGRTSVVVAHRLSTIKSCNQIVVLDKGRVVEEGTHSSLLGKGQSGVYYSLVSLQSRAATDTSGY